MEVRGQRMWLQFVVVALIIYGSLMMILPWFLLNKQTNVTLDNFHLVMERAIGVIVLGSAYMLWHTITSEDQTVHTTFMLAQVMGTFLCVMAQFSAYNHQSKTDRLTEWYTRLSFLGSIFWLLVNLFYCVRSNNQSSDMVVQSTKLNCSLHLDFFLTYFLGMICYSWPDQTIRFLTNVVHINRIHIYLYRTCGAFLINSAFVSYHASNFLRDSDKRAQLFSRVYQNLVLLSLLLMLLYFNSVLLKQNISYILILGVIWTINAIYGCCSSTHQSQPIKHHFVHSSFP